MRKLVSSKLNRFASYALMGIAFSVISSQANAKLSYYDKEVKYKITVQNITEHLTMTPFLMEGSKYTYENHRIADFKLFELGEPASPGLKEQARSGSTVLLEEELTNNPAVCNFVIVDALLGPGEKKEVNLELPYKCKFLSASAMFLPSNDGIAATTHRRLPHSYHRDATFLLNAYDAGAEFNDGTCATKPGPTCNGTGSDDVNFKPDPLDFVRAFPPYVSEVSARISNLLNEGSTDDEDLAIAESLIFGQATFATPVAKITVRKVKTFDTP